MMMMVRRWEWEGEREGEGVGDSRKLRRLYIFGRIFVSVNFFNVKFFFYRAWNVSIGMNVLCPPST